MSTVHYDFELFHTATARKINLTISIIDEFHSPIIYRWSAAGDGVKTSKGKARIQTSEIQIHHHISGAMGKATMLLALRTPADLGLLQFEPGRKGHVLNGIKGFHNIPTDGWEWRFAGKR